MLDDTSISYFPVGNGDTSLITLPDASGDKMLNILIDCNIREGPTDADGNEIFDIHAYLLEKLPRDPDDRPHLDVFILTHPDQDHCLAFDRIFYKGDPTRYSEEDKKAGRIIVDEQWFAPRIFSPFEELCADATEFKNEAERRIELHKGKSKARNDAGNRLRVIGYSDNPDLEGLDEVLTVPGNEVNIIDNKEQPHFRFSIFAPVKDDTDDEWINRNDTSIVVMARFDIDGVQDAVRALFGGDSGAPIWERIVDVNYEKTLAWDLFMAPHHCSWHFFTEASHDDSEEPEPTSIAVLDAHREGAWVVASSKPIENNDDDPPSYPAAQLYQGSVGADHFLCTGETPEVKAPRPIVFVLASTGPVRGESPENLAAATAAIRQTTSTPKTYGSS